MEKRFETTDLGLAAFLVTTGYRLEEIKKEKHKGTFYFPNGDALHESVMSFLNDQAMIRANKYHRTLKNIKSLIC